MSDHLSDFLLITGSEWTEIPNFSSYLALGFGDPPGLQDMINSGDWANVTVFCEASGIIEDNTNIPIQAAKIYLTGEADNPVRFWIVR
jgi:hypothetical protein